MTSVVEPVDVNSRPAGGRRRSLPAHAGRVSTSHPQQHPARSAQDPDEGLPPEVRLLAVAAVLAVLAAVCVEAHLQGPVVTVLFLLVVPAGSLHSRPGFVLLTAFAAWAVHTGFVTGRDGALGLSDGRWQELLVFAAAALLTCWGDRARGGARP